MGQASRSNIAFQQRQQAHVVGGREFIPLAAANQRHLIQAPFQQRAVMNSRVNHVNVTDDRNNVAAITYQGISAIPNNGNGVAVTAASTTGYNNNQYAQGPPYLSYAAPATQTIIVQRPVSMQYSPAAAHGAYGGLQVPQGCELVRVVQQPSSVMDETRRSREEYILHQPGLCVVKASRPATAVARVINALPVHQMQAQHLQKIGYVAVSLNTNVNSGPHTAVQQPYLNRQHHTAGQIAVPGSVPNHSAIIDPVSSHIARGLDASISNTRPAARQKAVHNLSQTAASSQPARNAAIQASAPSTSLVGGRANSPAVGDDDCVGRSVMLGIDGDETALNDLQCILRKECIEAFSATAADVSRQARRKGGRPIILGQVGVRCVHCKHLLPNQQAQQAVSFPSSRTLIYGKLLYTFVFCCRLHEN